MRAPAPRISRWSLGVVWLFAAVLVVPMLWAPLTGSPFPLKGARQLDELPLAWIIVTGYLVTAAWLSVPAWHNVERLQVALGMTLASAIWSLFFSLALGFAWLAAARVIQSAFRAHAPSPGPEEVRRKLELARAHIDMGNRIGAEAALREVVAEGSDLQRREAAALLARITS
jgi:FimV-like protein